MSPLKQRAHEIVDRLSDSATWRDLVEEIEVRRRIEEGLADLAEGREVAHEEIRRQFLGR